MNLSGFLLLSFLSVIALLFTTVAEAASRFPDILVIFANNNDTTFA